MRIGLFFFMFFGFSQTYAANKMIVISVDGMRAEFYQNPDFPAPTLRRLAKEGVSATSVRTVFPTVTYANHTSMMTGHYPAVHGIHTNKIFDPEKGPLKIWNWETSRIKVPTFWQKARENGKTVAILMWPVTVGTRENWIVPEIFQVDGMRDKTQWGYIAEHATPGLMDELETALQDKFKKRPSDDDAWDEWDTGAAVYIRDKYKPDLLMVHINMMDNIQHEFGRDGPEIREAMKKTDEMIRKIVGKPDPSTCVVVLGDHGLASYKKLVHPNILLVKGGWIRLDESGKLKSWDAVVDNNGPGAAVHVKDKSKIPAVLEYLRKNSGGHYSIISKSRLQKLRALPAAAFALEAAKNYSIGTKFKGELVTEEKRTSGAHGYLPSNPDMSAGFIAAGCGIAGGRSIGSMNMVDVAPTLARLLGFSMGKTAGRAVEIRPRP